MGPLGKTCKKCTADQKQKNDGNSPTVPILIRDGSVGTAHDSRAVHCKHTIWFVWYSCMGKTPVLSRLQIYKLTAIIFMAVNHIVTVNFSRILALYRYTDG